MLLENKVVVTSEAITQALGHTSILSLLLDQGAMPKASNLEDAIENEHSFSILLLLLRHPQLFPDFQPQSISLALNSGPTKTIEIFLQLGQALPHIELEDSALHRAAAKGHCEIVQRLISKGFDVNAEGKYGENPLHRACDGGYCEVVRLLLDASVAVNGSNGSKLHTPLAYTLSHTVRNMLVEKGVFIIYIEPAGGLLIGDIS